MATVMNKVCIHACIKIWKHIIQGTKTYYLLLSFLLSSTAATVRIYLETMTVSWGTALSWRSSTMQKKRRGSVTPSLQLKQMLWLLPTSAVWCSVKRKFLLTLSWTSWEMKPLRSCLPVSVSFKSKFLRMQRGEKRCGEIKRLHLKLLKEALKLAQKETLGIRPVDISTDAGAWWIGWRGRWFVTQLLPPVSLGLLR